MITVLINWPIHRSRGYDWIRHVYRQIATIRLLGRYVRVI